MKNYFIFACILVTAVVSIHYCVRYFSSAGDDLIDIRQVATDPEDYAGQILTSSAIMVDPNHFRHRGGTRNWHLALKTSRDLDAEVKRIHRAYGKGKSVIIEYEMYDQATLAEIMAYQEAEERLRGRSQRKRSLEKERGRFEKPVRESEAIEKLWLEAKAKLQRLTEEKEQLVKELAQLRAGKENQLERTSEIEANLQRLAEERPSLVKERARLLASEEENRLQRASEIGAKLQQLTEEKRELTKQKDKLQPEIKIEAELQRLATEETRLRGLAKDREAREQSNRDRARSAEEQAKSLGEAASKVKVVSPSTPYPTYSRRRRVSSTGRSSTGRSSTGRSSTRRSSNTSYVGGPTSSQLRQEQRADAEREQYAAQKKRQSKLFAQQKKRTQLAVKARALANRCAKEQVELQQLIKKNVELQRAIREKRQLQHATKEKQRLWQLNGPKEILRELVKEEANLQQLTKQKELLLPSAKANASKLAAIAAELAKIEKAEKAEGKIEFPLGSDGLPLENINYIGILWDIRTP